MKLASTAVSAWTLVPTTSAAPRKKSVSNASAAAPERKRTTGIKSLRGSIDPEHLEIHRARRGAELDVVRRKRQIGNLRPDQERACQMHSIERAENRRKGLRGTLEHTGADGDQVKRLEVPRDDTPTFGDRRERQVETKARSVQRAKALDPDQL